MKHIILEPSHITQLKQAIKDYMLTTQWGTWKKYVKEINEDFNPIRVRDKSGKQRWVLPIEVRNNPKFSKLKEIADGITGIKIIDLTSVDFPAYELGQPTDYSEAA